MSVESPAHDRRSPLHPALSMRQGYAILEELASVRNLMRASIDAIRTMGYVRLDVLTGHVSRYGSSGSIACRQCFGTHVHRIADGFWR